MALASLFQELNSPSLYVWALNPVFNFVQILLWMLLQLLFPSRKVKKNPTDFHSWYNLTPIWWKPITMVMASGMLCCGKEPTRRRKRMATAPAQRLQQGTRCQDVGVPDPFLPWRCNATICPTDMVVSAWEGVRGVALLEQVSLTPLLTDSNHLGKSNKKQSGHHVSPSAGTDNKFAQL